MGPHLEVLVPELANVFRPCFQAMTRLMQSMQSEMATNTRNSVQAQAVDFQNILADSQINVVSNLKQPSQSTLTATTSKTLTTGYTNTSAIDSSTSMEHVNGIIQYKISINIVSINYV